MLIGLDAGTSVVKAAAFAADGAVLRVAAHPTRVLSPKPGYSEQDVEETVAAAGEAIREAAAGEAPALIGITAQGDGVWLLDEAGRSVRPAILWSDARAADVLARWMADGVALEAFRRSGNMLFPGAAAPLLAFLAEHEPAALAAATTAGYCTDAIRQRLTGARATDASDASLPFFDPAERRYDPALLDLFGLLAWERLLAPVDPSPAPLRPLSIEGAALCGVPAGTPVHAGPFDLCATAIGAGLERPGDALVVVGTTLGCAVLADRPDIGGEPAGMLLSMPRADRWLRVMPAMVGTPSLEWLLGIIGAGRDEVDGLLAASPGGAGGVVCLPLLSPAGERAPFVDPGARGRFVGLSLETGRADLLRATCEGIAYAARHCLEAAGFSGYGRVVLAGGGMRSTGWRQILADVLGRPLLLARQPEPGARGAAMTALAAAGIPFDRVAWTKPEAEVQPEAAAVRFYEEGYAAYRAHLHAARGMWDGPRR